MKVWFQRTLFDEGSRTTTPGLRVGFKDDEDDADEEQEDGSLISARRSLADEAEGRYSRKSADRCLSPSLTIISDYGSEWTVPGPDYIDDIRAQLGEDEAKSHERKPRKIYSAEALPPRADTASELTSSFLCIMLNISSPFHLVLIWMQFF